jgi:hypothetical protein
MDKVATIVWIRFLSDPENLGTLLFSDFEKIRLGQTGKRNLNIDYLCLGLGYISELE